MADRAIIDLTPKSTLDSTDAFAVDTEDQTYKITAADLSTALRSLGLGVPVGAWMFWELSTPPAGWVLGGQGKTIGNASSNATSRANDDCWPLFEWIYNNFGNGERPIYSSSGSPGIRGANAAQDWALNKAIQVNYLDDRFVKAKASGTTLRATGGAAEHQHTVDSHVHSGPSHKHGRGSLHALLTWTGSPVAVRFFRENVSNWTPNFEWSPSPNHVAGTTTTVNAIATRGNTANDGTQDTGSAAPDTDLQNHEPPFIIQNIIVKL